MCLAHIEVPVTVEVESHPSNSETQTLPDFDDYVQSVPLESDFDNAQHETVPEKNQRSFQVLSLAQMFMKLEFERLVPARTVNYVANEIMTISEENHLQIEMEVKEHLQQLELDSNVIDSVLNSIFGPLKNQYKCLRSAHLRTKFYKTMNRFVEPKIADAKGDQKYFHIPISQTLLGLFEDKSALNIQLEPPLNTDPDILKDFTDGANFKNNKFFQENPTALRLIIYQDGFECCCPIGPSKKKHKFTGIYLSIGNLPSHLRTHVDNIFLIALLKEKDMDHKKVFGKIVEELKDLETNGIFVPGYGQIKAGLAFIAGDNLGSHSLGGFYESFSRTRYFCRFCYVDRPTFHSAGGHYVAFPLRTKETHQRCLRGQRLETKKGVKFDSVFNELPYFHVCDPGLPSCCAHDLAEGVGAWDMGLFIHYFVSEEWFDYEKLTELRKRFPFSTKDKRDEPIDFLEEYARVKGGAMQIFNTIRLFPLIIKDHIKDPNDKVWKCFLLLSEICDIILAPAINKKCLGYLEELILLYLDLRKECFPDVPLRPKHHYLAHACLMILLFGPLKNIWSLRFESKHCFFKRAVRSAKNFINVLKSLTFRHELYQCYLRSGARARCSIVANSSSDFSPSMYSEELQLAMSECDLPPEVEECTSVSVKGTDYRKGHIVVLGQDSYQCNEEMGRILIILHCDDAVFFVVEVLEVVFVPHIRAYKLGQKVGYKCVKQSNLLSYYAHHTYKLHDGNFVKLHHALVVKY
ncbi:uncharacterized protein LOC117643344 [Thrips palmi]|uniref:Uncharacterized protein LOC117643344 n=1 Tax=Thrips palmi TaxID=161013 RepID=A0A6P8YMM0_THRPL|nr:uncharacterized protein LOC117643344 [Thrips palmi]